MPRPIWEGSITFGLVNVPIALYPGESRSELQFNLLDSQDMSRIRYKRVSERTGEEVPGERIVKAYQLDDGTYVPVTALDFQAADARAAQAIEIEGFVDKGAVGYVYFDRPYYLVPGKKAEKGYVLLRETLKRTGKIGIARVVIRTRQHLAAVIPEGDALILELLRYAHELRGMEDYKIPGPDPAEYRITDKELELAEHLVGIMAGEWEPEKYRDEYHDALLAWIERKAREGEGARPPERPEPRGVVVDFMELLKRSVEESEKAKAGAGEPAGQADEEAGHERKTRRAGRGRAAS